MPATRDEPPMAVDKVRYMAEAVAGVAAIDETWLRRLVALSKLAMKSYPVSLTRKRLCRRERPRFMIMSRII